VSHSLVSPETVLYLKYCNGFDECFARKQLCKHGSSRNNRANVYSSLLRRQSAHQWTDEIDIT
jgi:hypothetical protein